MNNPDRPYEPAQTAAQQKMQSPQSGTPATTGGQGYGAGGPLPQAPGEQWTQAGSLNLEELVQHFVDSLPLGLGSNEAQSALMRLRQAANAADEALRQYGLSQYPAPPAKPVDVHPIGPEKTRK